MGDSPEERRTKRSRRETSYKAKAFEKFKQLKSGNRNKYDVEEMENVYEVVEEKEYVKQILSRQDDDWIVDDDGSGYVEDGRDIFDDDLDSESINQATTKGKGTKRKKKALSENAGKGSLHQMLSKMPSKKKEEVKIDDDAMLSEILGEIDDTSQVVIKPKAGTVVEYSTFSRKQAAKDYMKSFSLPSMAKTALVTPKKRSLNPKSKVETGPCKKTHLDNAVISTDDGGVTEKMEDDSPPVVFEDTQQTSSSLSDKMTIESDFTQDMFDDDLDMTQIEEFESQDVMQENQEVNTTLTEDIVDGIQAEFMSEWESIGNSEIDVTELDKADIPLVDVDNKKVFRFFWWDAYEDNFKQPGVVFLFGKTYSDKTKSFVSCCVAVRNINRRLFVLPRPFMLGEGDKETDEPVTFKDVYNEINDILIKPKHISTFRTRSVKKKYCFDPEIPSESDYLELRYPAKDAKIDFDMLSQTPKTFSKIFGTNSNYLEIFLLERRIKGPCWLDILNPVPVTNPMSWCKCEVNCMRTMDVLITSVSSEKTLPPPPPLVVCAINMRTAINPRTLANEIVMMSCLSHTSYAVDKKAPNPPFQQHFCAFAAPSQHVLPLKIHDALHTYKATKVQKMDSENGMLNYFMTQFAKIDPDLIIGHDLQGYQINLLADRLTKQCNKNFSKLGRLKRSEMKQLERHLFSGRLVCDLKIAAKELIKSRSYDLDTLCQVVLHLKDNQRVELEPEDVLKMFQTSDDILKLISLTMQDTSYILKMMYDLNVIPLAMQITNIAGNVMSKTLMGGRSERNEFLLLHAFSEKDYIVPDKKSNKKSEIVSTKKKPSYAGGLVLDPKVGFYDKLILLMDFNSLYPSIIQEYNICFTTMPPDDSEDNLQVPDKGLPAGILPTEIRKLVESRREVKKLMTNSEISNDLRMQYNIRQMALKLTANSMYGCLGFGNSRFYAKNLAALVTHKGREILTNTRDMVEKMMFEVVYGDTDSIMINTNILDYDQVFKIGVRIKQEINKLYKQVELDIDGVFKYLLLLKKKKYAAVVLSKSKDGKLKEIKEYKGLDIIRRDWSQISAEAGKYILEHILSDQSQDDRINNIISYLRKIKEDMHEGKIPIPLLVITKQLTKDPRMYTDKNSLPHVQVALRYNQQSGGHLRAGDTVPYVICLDGTDKSATQRGYHLEELKNNENLKVDTEYYLAQQIHPVVTRICEPIEGIDAFLIAECLGLDTKSFKKPQHENNNQLRLVDGGENITRPEVRFRDVEHFTFKCYGCKEENAVKGFTISNPPFLDKCGNPECHLRPIDYLPYIQNQLELAIHTFIGRYYDNMMTCEDPGCKNDTNSMPLNFVKRYPVCTMCQEGVMYRMYTENQLYTQLAYFHYMFDLSKLGKKPLIENDVDSGYHALKETVEKYMSHSSYAVLELGDMFSNLLGKTKAAISTITKTILEPMPEYSENEDDL